VASVNDIPVDQRGTLTIGGLDYHYMRSARTNALYLVPGKDTRNWSQIDSGAVSYADMAVAEHNAAGGSFTGHDGPRLTAACPLCAEGGVAGKDEVATLRALAAQRDQNGQYNRAATNARKRLTELGHDPDQVAPADTLIMPTITPERQALLDQQQAQREADAARAEAQALADQQLREQLKADMLAEQQTQQQAANAQAQAAANTGVTGAADPKDNAGLPPTDPDVIAGADPQVLATAVVTVDGGTAPPLTEDRELGPFHNPANDTFSTQVLEPGMGRDPETGNHVKITRNPGADPDAPYGRKKDGTARRRGGKRVAQ
jgi:hypothetical protein